MYCVRRNAFVQLPPFARRALPFILAFSTGLAVAGAAQAQVFWDGPDGNFGNAINWSNDAVPDQNTPETIINIDGVTVVVTNGQDAGSNVPGGTLTVSGGSTLSLLAGGALRFEKLIIGATDGAGNFVTANDDWSLGCTNPCITMAGGTWTANAGSNGYNDGFTFAAGTTNTLQVAAGNAFNLGPSLSTQHFGVASIYNFEAGSVLQIGGTVTYEGSASVSAGANTGLVILSGGLFQANNPQDPLGGGGVGEITSKVSTTTINSGGILDFNGISGIINDLQGEGTLRTGAAGAVISLGQGDFGGVIQGAGGITQLGGGTTFLSGTNTYTGPTTIDANGALFVNGSLAAASVVTVNGTLGGIGSVGATTLGATGTISPGAAAGQIGTLATGALDFAPTSQFLADVNVAGGLSDSINVTGAATLDGTVVANVTNVIGPSQSFTLLQSTAPLTDNGIALAGVTNTLVVTYALSTTTNELLLNVDIDFSPAGAGLNANQTAIAEHLDDANSAGGGGILPVLTALAGLQSASEYAAALDQLSPEIYSYQKIETLFAAEQFSADLMSCKVADGSGEAVIREGQCIWVRGRARALDLDSTPDNIGADSTVGSFSAGAQLALAPDWKLGFAAGYDTISTDSGNATSDGDRGNIGAVLKYNPGPFLLAGSVSGGWASYDTTRSMAFGGFAGTASGDGDIDYVSGRVHAAYVVDAGGWYVMPMVDGTVTRVDLDGFTETGTPAALAVAGGSDTIWGVSPALEIGSEFRLGDVSVLRPFVRAGVTWRDSDSVDLTAGFAGAPAGTDPFVIVTGLDDVLGDVSAGFDVINREGAALRLQYDGRFADETRQNSASIKGSVPF